MNRKDMVARMEAILAAATADNNRALTEAETVEFDGLDASIAQIDAALQASAAIEARRARVVAARTAAPADVTVPVTAVSARKPGDEAPKEFANLGEFVVAALSNPKDARLQYVSAEERQYSNRSEQRMDTGSLGGFMVPEQFRSDIFSVDVQQAIVRPRAVVIPAGSPPDAAITLPYLDQSADMFGGMHVNWVNGEGGTKPDTSGSLGLQRLEPQEWAGVMTFTDKLLRNWTAAGAFFTAELRKSAMSFEDFAFLRGTGVGQPLGVINSAAAIQVARQTASVLTFQDYVNMTSKILPGGNPVWLLSLGLRASVTAMRNPTGDGGNGELVWAPSTVVGTPDTLGGYPIIWNTRAPAPGALGDAALVDLSYYLIKDGSGPFIASDGGIVNFKNNKTLIKVFGNVDGGPRLNAPVVTEGGYTVSPFVLLK